MNAELSPAIALVVEANADARTVQALIDGRLRAGIDWMRDNDLDYLRRWEPILIWKNVPEMCEQHHVVVHGRFESGSAAPDARAARRALALVSKLGTPHVVVLVRDADNQPERRHGLEQGRGDHHHGLDIKRIAIGVSHPTREAWHLVGFVPETAAETQALSQERKRLSLDPTREPERLVRKGERAIKPVLECLTDGDHDRQQRCLECPTELLRERGRECGLSDFLDELDQRVVEAFR